MLQVSIIALWLFVGYGLVIEDSSLLTRIPGIIGHVCPGSDVCSSNRSSEAESDISFAEGKESCCAECSCSTACSKTGNCCFPNTTPHKNVNAGKVEDFQNSRSCLYPMFPQPETAQKLYQSLLMVSSVQNNSKGGHDELSNVSCGDINVAPWGSLYPVYSAKSRQIYKNKECAREGGEDDDVLVWNVVIHCRDEEITKGMSMAATVLDTESITENCRVNFIFPGSYDVFKPLMCYINLIETCSESYDFRVPDRTNASKDDIRTLCTKSGFLSPYRANKMYANVFCHICNEAFFRHTFCKKIAVGLDGIVKGGIVGGFTALIDGKFITEKRDTKNDRERDLPTICSAKNISRCRLIICPTGQLRDTKNKCVYPNKIWFNQNYAVYINLTLDKLINMSEAFGIPYEKLLSLVLPPMKSVWLEKWSVSSINYRVMDEPQISNNVIIIMHRKLSSVEPDYLISNIKKMIGKAWSIRVRNVKEVLKSAYFSMRKSFTKKVDRNKSDDFYNLAKNLEWPQYEMVYKDPVVNVKEHIISRLYVCNQVELEPSEFLLNSEKDALYIYTSRRVLFDNQFFLMHSKILSKSRARVCIEDSGLYERNKNMGAILKTFDLNFVVVSTCMLSRSLLQSFL